MRRRQVVMGNWKMNKTLEEAKQFLLEFLPRIENHHHLIALLVPFTALATVAQLTKETQVFVGSENIHTEEKGAFTGEISAHMVKEAGAQFVIVGHSERRNYFQEDNDIVNKKLKMALKSGLKPILCVGETLDEKEEERTEEVLQTMLLESLQGLSKEELSQVFIAYEPVWAIGTGLAASSEIVQNIHHFCRNVILQEFGKEAAHQISILYGGSVNEENISSLLAMKDVDGVLVGGASLNPHTFAKLCMPK